MKRVRSFLGWFFGASFLMGAIGCFINGTPFSGLVFVVWALLCLPPVNQFAQQRGFRVHFLIKTIIFLASIVLVNLVEPSDFDATPVAEQSPVPTENPSAVASVSPSPIAPPIESSPAAEAANQAPFGFNQELTRVHAAYADSGFFAEWKMNNSQLELVRRDDNCNLRAWKMPEDQTMRGLQVNLRDWTPDCADALRLAVATLAPAANYSAIERQVSEFSAFVEEVDPLQVKTLSSEDGVTIEAIWVDNGSYCPVGSCELSIQIEQAESSIDRNSQGAIVVPTPNSITAEPVAGQIGTLTASTSNARINLRDQPSTSTPTQRYGLDGDRVILQETATGSDGQTWYKVQFQSSGAIGWVRADFVEF